MKGCLYDTTLSDLSRELNSYLTEQHQASCIKLSELKYMYRWVCHLHHGHLVNALFILKHRVCFKLFLERFFCVLPSGQVCHPLSLVDCGLLDGCYSCIAAICSASQRSTAFRRFCESWRWIATSGKPPGSKATSQLDNCSGYLYQPRLHCR